MLLIGLLAVFFAWRAQEKAWGAVGGFVVGAILALFVLPGVFPPEMKTVVTQIDLGQYPNGTYVRAETIRNRPLLYYYKPVGADKEKYLEKGPYVKFNWSADGNTIPTLYKTESIVANGLTWLWMIPAEPRSYVFIMPQSGMDMSKLTPLQK